MVNCFLRLGNRPNPTYEQTRQSHRNDVICAMIPRRTLGTSSGVGDDWAEVDYLSLYLVFVLIVSYMGGPG